MLTTVSTPFAAFLSKWGSPLQPSIATLCGARLLYSNKVHPRLDGLGNIHVLLTGLCCRPTQAFGAAFVLFAVDPVPAGGGFVPPPTYICCLHSLCDCHIGLLCPLLSFTISASLSAPYYLRLPSRLRPLGFSVHQYCREPFMKTKMPPPFLKFSES